MVERHDYSAGWESFDLICARRLTKIDDSAGWHFGVFAQGVFCGEVDMTAAETFSMSHSVGYWIDREARGRGYAGDAINLLLRYAFTDIGAHRVQFEVLPRNTASKRVMEKLTMRSEGTAERLFRLNGVWEDYDLHAITAEEWPGGKVSSDT